MAKEKDSRDILINSLVQGSEFTGNLTTPKDTRVDGTFIGDINSKQKVIIGESGLIKGKVECSDMDIFGKLEGDIKISGMLTIKSGASVNGNVETLRVSIEAGAHYSGNFSMLKSDKK